MKLSVSQISDLNIPSEINPQIINRIFSSAATNLASTLQVIGVSSISIGVVPSLASTQHMISSYELFDDIPKELSTIASKIVPSIASYMSGFGIGAIKMSTEPEDVDNLKKLWETIIHIDTTVQNYNDNVNSEYTNNKELTVTPDPLPTNTNGNNTIFRNTSNGGCRRSSCGLKLNNKPQAPVITEDSKPTDSNIPQPHLITVKESDTNTTDIANTDNTDSTGGSATISNITNLTNIPPDVLQYIADVIKSNKRAEIKTVTVENSK